VAGAGALRGAKDTKVPMVITLFAYWIVGLPMGYSLGILAGYGPKALWVGPIVGLTAAGLLLMLRFQRMILWLPMVEKDATIPSSPSAESALTCGTDAG
jgi:MATE family multidrug resistance protein